jgi:molybdate transport system substrate-binding protein
MWWVYIANSIALASSLLLFAACKPSASSRPKLYLASSLAPLHDMIQDLVDEPLDLVFLSSSAIAKQIERGAPCELAILADELWRDYLIEKNLVTKVDDALMTNSLVLASIDIKKEEAASFFARMPSQERLIIADPDFVPLGRYTREALQAFGAYEKLLPSLVRASSARQATIMLTERAARYAMLYRSDAVDAHLNVVSTLAKTSHRPIRYPLIACKSARTNLLPHLTNALLSERFKQGVTAKGFH